MISIKFTLTPRKKDEIPLFFPIHICNFILFFLVSDIILKMAIPEKSVFFDEHRRHTKHTKGKNEIQLSRTKAGNTQQKNL